MPDPMARITEPGLTHVVNAFRLFDSHLLRALPAILTLIETHAFVTYQEKGDVLNQAIDLALGETA